MNRSTQQQARRPTDRSMLHPARRLVYWILGAVMTLTLPGCGGNADGPDVTAGPAPMIVVYANLPAERMARVASDYRDDSGVLVNYMLDDDLALVASLAAKEHRPGADVLLIAGAGPLAAAVDADILRPIQSAALVEAVAEADRDPDGYWYAVGRRTELIAYDTRTVNPTELRGYEGLADETWRGKLCLQRSGAGRSLSLVATLIASLGERDAELTVRGWRANLAGSVFDDQRELLEQIASGDCALGLVSSDQAALYLDEERPANLAFHRPSGEEGGAIDAPLAAGVARHANDASMATDFLEWLVTPRGQAALHAMGADYPLLAEVAPADSLASLPDFSAPATRISASRAGYFFREAERLVERARYR